jgi:hypothetical protein
MKDANDEMVEGHRLAQNEMLSALKEEKKAMRGEVHQMTTDFADQLDNVHSKLKGVSQQLDGALTIMLGLSADLK